MRLTKEGNDRYRGQDGVLYNRAGEVVNESNSAAQTIKEAFASLGKSDAASEQTQGAAESG